MRRCVLGCSPIAKFLDEDTRRHLCANHREEFEKVEAGEELPREAAGDNEVELAKTET